MQSYCSLYYKNKSNTKNNNQSTLTKLKVKHQKESYCLRAELETFIFILLK